MSKRMYILIQSNITESIMEGRKEKFGTEQIVVFVKPQDKNSTYDIAECIDLVIGIKVKKDERYYSSVITFGNSQVTDENIQKALSYLMNIELNEPMLNGVPIVPTPISEIS